MLPLCHRIAFVLLAVFHGCGESAQPRAQAPTQASPQQAPEETDAEKLQRQQRTTVAAMCDRLTDCAVRDSRSQGSIPEEELTQLAPRLADECETTYNMNDLSPQQLVTIRDCVAAPSECSAFTECLARLVK